MSKEKIRLLHIIYAILLGLLAAALGICFILGCLRIYGSGSRPFSREVIAAEFSRFALLAYAFLGLTVAGFVLNLVLPLERGKEKARPDQNHRLSRLVQTADFESFPSEVSFSIKKERVRRVLLISVASLLYLAAFVASSVFILTGGSSENVITQMLMLVATLAVPFFFSVFVTYFCQKSVKNEAAAIRSALAEDPSLKLGEPKLGTLRAFFKNNGKRIALAVRLTLIAAGIVLTVAGIGTGGIEELLGNAIKLCKSCVGIG
jgi:hypothetical protein